MSNPQRCVLSSPVMWCLAPKIDVNALKNTSKLAILRRWKPWWLLRMVRLWPCKLLWRRARKAQGKDFVEDKFTDMGLNDAEDCPRINCNGDSDQMTIGDDKQALTGTRYPTLPGLNFYYPYPTRKSFENLRVQGSNYTCCFHTGWSMMPAI